ncbi:hydroxymethylglutaryl-CoA lyase YngG [mine drainage metagenome]|uniref:hydroxymethylglutaryl-CoA lyase n=1 Tax=mine drainage metagenome TaxID=410659 RepID=A0A1J5RRC2_9ZZZZ
MIRPARVKVVEVGPRDGLQNEAQALPIEIKLRLVEDLAEAGLAVVEAGSFVSPRWVPQMAASAELYQRLRRRPGTAYPALVPNDKGLEAALEAGVAEVAVFIAASDGFSQKNIACSVADSLTRVGPVIRRARERGLLVRGYVSCVVACPYDGATDPARVADLSAWLMDQGCYEVSLGDTIGIATADQVRRLIGAVAQKIPREDLALHFHDTYGQGVANILASLEEGVAVFDSSVAGLGGCPYARGATGNVATEDVLHLLHGLGIETGVDALKVARAGGWISERLNRPNGSRAGRALLAAG